MKKMLGFLLYNIILAFSNLINISITQEIKDKNDQKSLKFLNAENKFLENLMNLENRMKKFSSIKKLKTKFITKDNRYIVADETIKSGEYLFEVPFNHLYHIENPKIKEFCLSLNISSLTNEILHKRQNLCLFFFLLKNTIDPEEEYLEYIETLPKSLDEYPILWSNLDKKLFKNSLLENSVKFYENYIGKLFEEFKASVYFKEKKPEIEYQFTDAVKANLMFGSRIFGINVKETNKLYYVLMPYIDLCNTSHKVNTDWTTDLNGLDSKFIIFAKENIEKGDEIFLEYGDNNNQHLLSNYGFTIEDNYFPNYSEFFSFEFSDIKFERNRIDFDSDESLKNIIFSLREKFEVPREQFSKFDYEVCQAILESLEKYSNKERIELLDKDKNNNLNIFNLYRALVEEDKLIDKNIQFVIKLLSILQKGKEILKKTEL